MVTVIDTASKAALRHPEKRNRPDSAVLAKPDWLENVPAASSDIALDPSRATAATQLAKLVLAGKNLGELRRAHKQPPWASEPQMPLGLPTNPSDPPGRLRRLTAGAARKAKRGGMSLITHVQ